MKEQYKIICQLCEKEIPLSSFGRHLYINHKNISFDEYLRNYNPHYKKCVVCGSDGIRQKDYFTPICKECAKKNIKEITGKENYFYGKKYSDDDKKMIDKMYPEHPTECEECGNEVKYSYATKLRLCGECSKQYKFTNYECLYNNAIGKNSYGEENIFLNLPMLYEYLGDKEKAYRVWKYCRNHHIFFSRCNINNKDFVDSKIKLIINSNYTLDIEKIITTSDYYKNKANLIYLPKLFFIERGFSNDEAEKLVLEHTERIKQSATTSRLCDFIERHGDEEGRRKYNLFCSRSANTKENFQKRFGDDWENRWASYIDKTKQTLENFIKRYGEEQGKIKWIKYLETKSLPSSKAANSFFEKLMPYIKCHDEIYTDSLGKEWFVSYDDEDGCGIYFVDFKYKNKIIEFYGDYWHKNPLFYEDNEENDKKREYDKIRLERIRNVGFDVLVIWENEVGKNLNDSIIKCIEFISE